MLQPTQTLAARAALAGSELDGRRSQIVNDQVALLGGPGEYLCFEDGGRVVVVGLDHEWTRIGRGLAADVRFDDPTVSRRHALIIRGVDGVRIIDDGSLNGVFVNGQPVEWSPLAHGDEIRIGRRRLYYATHTPTSAAASAAYEQVAA
jgi:pSer/pThr/pTyr-binding forkhead associated (FHA) protein